MTNEARMTNYRKRPVEGQSDLKEEEFWRSTDEACDPELREEVSAGKPVFDLEERSARFGEGANDYMNDSGQFPVIRFSCFVILSDFVIRHSSLSI